jgi:SMODS-associated and fused to various effectors sensor domain/TIR domain
MREQAKTRFDPFGPIFISNRKSDGASLATDLAWALRAHGLPVWHYETDQPPGDIEGRIEQAMAAGLSGAVILVTPEAAQSEVVRFVEVPRLLELQRSEASFAIAIATTIGADASSGESLKPDYEAPDRILGLRPGTLRGLKQYRYFERLDAVEIAAALANRRMALFRSTGAISIDVDIQTRESPGAWHSRAPLVIRLQPPDGGKRTPSRDSWQVFAPFVASLPGLLAEAGVAEVRFRGGSHLSAAVALGAALPTTTVWRVSVTGSDGSVWDDPGDGLAADVACESEQLAPGGHLAVMVDCVPGAAHNAFEGLVNQLQGQVGATLRIRAAHTDMVAPGQGAATANVIARRIRDEAAQRGTTGVHLAMRAPFPLALMLGRRLNTLEVALYEWEGDEGTGFYEPTIRVASGQGKGIEVTSERRP